MKIGIIGAGLIGKTLAQKLSTRGHHIVIANSRGPHTISFADGKGIQAVELRETINEVDAVIITIPFGKVADLPKGLFNQLDRTVPVIETMNYFPHRDGIIEDIEHGKAHSVWVQEQVGRPVVKAFNNIVAHSFAKFGQPGGASGRIALTVAGDHEAQKNIAKQLVDDTGFDAYDTGTIAESWRQQPGSPVYCTDLTLAEMNDALTKADKETIIRTRDIESEKVAELGEGYMAIIVSGNYPKDFDDPAINLFRSVNGLPLK